VVRTSFSTKPCGTELEIKSYSLYCYSSEICYEHTVTGQRRHNAVGHGWQLVTRRLDVADLLRISGAVSRDCGALRLVGWVMEVNLQQCHFVDYKTLTNCPDTEANPAQLEAHRYSSNSSVYRHQI
jgi:hypothetical protein